MIENKKIQIKENISLANNIYKMTLKNDGVDFKPGQFINIKIPGKYLRRPISVSEFDENSIIIIYKIVGYGTKWLSEQREGSTIEALMPLGNGFEISTKYNLIVGGGIGVPPLVEVCKQIYNSGQVPKVILGFKNKNEIFYLDKFREMSNLYVCTDDGSYGEKGLVTDIMKKNNFVNLNYITCGATLMEKAVYRCSNASGQISLEERMGCGFGACMGCSIETWNGPKRVCKDGPVFKSEDLKW